MMRQFRKEGVAALYRTGSSIGVAVGYGTAFLIAESTVAFVSTVAGVVLHSIILLVAIQAGIYIEASRPSLGERTYGRLMFFLACWSLADVTRLAGLGLPLGSLPVEIRPGILALVLEVAVLAALRLSDLRLQDLGLRFQDIRSEALVAASGLPLGLIAFALAPRSPLGRNRGVIALVIAAVFIALLGASAEILLRGLLQKASVGLLGRVGVPFTAVLSAATLLSERSFWLVLYGLLVGLFFGVRVYQRGSIVGVVVAHSLMAATMSVVWPRIL